MWKGAPDVRREHEALVLAGDLPCESSRSCQLSVGKGRSHSPVSWAVKEMVLLVCLWCWRLSTYHLSPRTPITEQHPQPFLF